MIPSIPEDCQNKIEQKSLGQLGRMEAIRETRSTTRDQSETSPVEHFGLTPNSDC